MSDLKESVKVGNLEFAGYGAAREDGIFYNEYSVTAEGTHEIIHNVVFQSGPVPEVGANGLTIEVLLAICEHRLSAFQETRFKSDYNAQAIGHIQKAVDALNQRTADREERGVDGTYEE